MSLLLSCPHRCSKSSSICRTLKTFFLDETWLTGDVTTLMTKVQLKVKLVYFYVFLSPPVSGRIAGANLKVLHFLDNLSFSHGNLLFGDFEHVEQIWLRAWYFAEIIFCYSDTPCSCSGHWFICSGYRAKVAKSVRGFIFRQNSTQMLC